MRTPEEIRNRICYLGYQARHAADETYGYINLEDWHWLMGHSRRVQDIANRAADTPTDAALEEVEEAIDNLMCDISAVLIHEDYENVPNCEPHFIALEYDPRFRDFIQD